MTAISKSGYFLTLTILILSAITPAASALTEPPIQDAPETLSLIVLKMTGEEYAIIKNNGPTAISDLSHFSLKAFNNSNPLISNVTVTTQTLPAVNLGQGEILLLSSTIRPTCGASLAGKLSVSLVDGSGRLEIIQAQAAGTGSGPIVVDSVSWSSTTSGDIKSVPSNSKAPLTIYYRVMTGDTYSWQLAEMDSIIPCQLNVSVPGSPQPNAVAITPDEIEPMQGLTIEPIAFADTEPADDLSDSALPIQINELVPNPSGTGNDTTDEFIELHNPNNSDFDLSGYRLQTGISRLYDFTFKPDTLLPANSHKAFYSAITGLTLSNTLGQARLLSPNGESLSATDVYRSAKDGQSWSLNNNLWSWSTVPTPNALNLLQVPKLADKKSALVSNSQSKRIARESAAKKPKAVKAPKAAKPAKPKKIKAEKTTKYSTGTDTKTLMERPIQTKLVATVGSVAVLYGAYEYRSSLANGFYKLRRKLGFGHPDRSQP